MRSLHSGGAALALFTLLGVAASGAQAQTTLGVGDIAFSAYDSAAPDTLQLVLLRDITNGTTFTLTDNAYSSAGALGTTEGTLVFTAASDLAAGTLLFFQNQANAGAYQASSTGFGAPSSNFALNGSGDNVFIIQGTLAAPTFIASFLSQSDYLSGGVATSSSTTYLPSALTVGSSAVALTSTANNGNSVFNSSTTGTRPALQSALFTASNFTTSSTNINASSFPTSFTVTSGNAAAPEPGSLVLLGTGVLGVAGTLLRRRKAA